ncbi:MAG: hypothetical protein ACI9NQ_000492 [Paracoccaceae bacterium]|jgi:hypothetical protein
MSDSNDMIGRAEDGREKVSTQTSPWARGILLGGMLTLVVSVLVTDASRLSGEWARFSGVLMGNGAEAKPSSSATERVLLWNDNVMGSIDELEKRLDLESPLCKWVQPRMQGWLASMGEGGEEVMIGREGWLFYRPSFDHLTARSALVNRTVPTERGYDAALAKVRDFAKYLRDRGIELVMVPVPPKLAVHPEKFVSGQGGDLIETPGYRRWVTQVEAEGVRVFDMADALSSFRAQSGVPAYLRSDTHWRPESMEWCAGKLVAYLEAEKLIKGSQNLEENIIVTTKMTGRGDLWRMLRLGRDNTLVGPEEVPLKQVRTSAGMRWQPSRTSEVLLLGDSFCNIYSLGQMGWGEGAGFAEHLGHGLRRPVDAILRNSDGAHATRQIIAQDLARGTDRLAGKSVVIWEFASRELTEGDWVGYDYHLGEKAESRFIEVDSGRTLELEATVVEVSPIPSPGSVPYQDFVATVHLRDLVNVHSGESGGTEVLAYASAMEANRWTNLAGVRSGQRVRVRLTSWIDAEGQFGRWNRSEASEDLLLESVNWLSEIKLVGDED